MLAAATRSRSSEGLSIHSICEENHMADTPQVAACCDENYATYATVMMLSALHSCRGSIDFHLINCGISSHTVDAMQQCIEDHGGTLAIYQPDDSLYEGIPASRYGIATYQRINLPEYIPSHIKKIIYIDSDTLVLNDLSDLWLTNMEGQPVAAVENLSPKACIGIGVERSDYFNAGILVMDLEQWRAGKIHREVTEYAREHAGKLQFHDQCSLNAVLQGRWTRLPVRWNMQSDIYKVATKYADGCSYSVEELEAAILTPGIVHFTGKKKPWKIVCFHPFKDYYRLFIGKTPWADQRPPDDTFQARWTFFTAFRQNWKYWRRKNQLSERYRVNQVL